MIFRRVDDRKLMFQEIQHTEEKDSPGTAALPDVDAFSPDAALSFSPDMTVSPSASLASCDVFSAVVAPSEAISAVGLPASTTSFSARRWTASAPCQVQRQSVSPVSWPLQIQIAHLPIYSPVTLTSPGDPFLILSKSLLYELASHCVKRRRNHREVRHEDSWTTDISLIKYMALHPHSAWNIHRTFLNLPLSGMHTTL